MLFSRNNKSTPIEVASQGTGFQADAMVLVCDTFLIFKNDMAVYQWAAEIMKESNSAYQLTPTTKVEAIVGYKGNKQALHANMRDLLNLMLIRMKLQPDKYAIKFFETEAKMPNMWMRGAIAVRLDLTQTYGHSFSEMGKTSSG